VFCRNCIESRDHLYFECGFTKRLWREVMRKCMRGAPKMDWELKKLKGKRVKGSNMQAGTGGKCIPYLVAKNCIIFRGQVNSEESIMKALLWDAKNSVFSKKGFKNSLLNRVLCFVSGIPLSVLSK
jgi:hypothetical protein